MKLVLRLYFRKIRIEGKENIPHNVPLLVTPNHQNAFLDALLVGAFIPVHLHFLTRSDVFKAWSRPFLKLLNMIPIYRIRDGYSKLSMNDSIFETCKSLFSTDKSVLIFPEGNHGEYHYLRPLSKGAARIALRSRIAIEKELMILPVGLNYFDHQAPRSTVLMVFGEPISVRDFIEQFGENAARAQNHLKAAISNGMKKTLIIPDPSDDYEDRKNVIFRPENSTLPFTELKTTRPFPAEKPRRKSGILARFLNPLPFLIIHHFLSGVEDVAFHSSLKLAIGLFVFPLWWLAVFTLFHFLWGTSIAALAVLVMVSGLFYSYE